MISQTWMVGRLPELRQGSLVDRLVHHAEILAIEGESYRFKEAQERADNRARRDKIAGLTPEEAAVLASLRQTGRKNSGCSLSKQELQNDGKPMKLFECQNCGQPFFSRAPAVKAAGSRSAICRHAKPRPH
jgi:hypothetical protein